MNAILEGWIDEVDDGWVWGRLIVHERETDFSVRLLDVMESQRVSLQPGSYVYVVNGELLVNNAIWTTHDMEQAKVRAKKLYHELGWDRPRPSPY